MVISNMVPIGSIFNFLHMHKIYKLYFSVCEKRMTSGWWNSNRDTGLRAPYPVTLMKP